MHNFGAGDLVEIRPEKGDTFLLPFTEEDFPEINTGARRLTASPAEELLPDSLQLPGIQRQESDDGTN
jgi:16S rRNA processing protein RimM